MKEMNINQLKELLLECYSKDLCYYKVKEKWNKNNKCLGMCAITALIVNKYFGGSICKIYVDNISHYFNYIDNKIVDLTASQFDNDIDYNNYEIIDKETILNEDTINRYNLLKEKTKHKMGETK